MNTYFYYTLPTKIFGSYIHDGTTKMRPTAESTVFI